uniref:YceK/YidQ family lipoprotein n=1 Tax=Pseudomonas graminis TaxID=158627 RepID=A0A7C1WVA5_9PSED
MLLSELADTLVLPYTIYQQNELGVIPVTRKQR